MKPQMMIIGDIHGCLKEFKEILTKVDPTTTDVVLVGDMIDRGPDSAEVVKLLRDNNYKTVIGNHDFHPYYNKNFHKLCSACGIHYLQDSSVTIDSVKFYGTPWTPPFYDWAFMKPEHELEDTFAQIPLDTDVLITHGPPFGILDTVPQAGHVGSRALSDAVEKLQLKAHIFGHIHNSYGHYTEDGTQYVNAAVMTERYKPTQEPTLITIKDQ